MNIMHYYYNNCPNFVSDGKINKINHRVIFTTLSFRPTTAGSFRQTPNQMEHSINSRNDPDTSINQNTPTDCESNSTHPQNTSEHTNPLNVRATPNGDIEMQNIQNDALCKPVTPTISVTVPQIDLKTTSPYNQAEGEVKHNPVFMDN